MLDIGYVTECVLSQIRHWVATFTKSVPSLPQHIMQAGQSVGHRFCGRFISFFHFLQYGEYLPTSRILEQRGKSSKWVQALLLIVQQLQQVSLIMRPCYQFVEQHFVLATAWIFCRDFYRIPLVNNSVECILVLLLEASADLKRWPVETPNHPLLGVLIKITFIHPTKFPLHQISTLCPRNASPLHLSFPALFPSTYLPSSSCPYPPPPIYQ